MSSTIVDASTIILNHNEVKALLNEYTTTDEFENSSVGDIWNQFIDEATDTMIDKIILDLATIIAPEVAPALEIAMTVADCIEIIQDALTYREINKYLSLMKSKDDRLKVMTIWYEWEAGSGNSHAYYSEIEFDIV